MAQSNCVKSFVRIQGTTGLFLSLFYKMLKNVCLDMRKELLEKLGFDNIKGWNFPKSFIYFIMQLLEISVLSSTKALMTFRRIFFYTSDWLIFRNAKFSFKFVQFKYNPSRLWKNIS